MAGAREQAGADLRALPIVLAQWAIGLPPRAGRTRVLAIDGRSGAGKSELADQVVVAAGRAAGAPVAGEPPVGPAPAVALVRMDETYPGWDGLQAGIDRVVRDLLTPLAQGRDAGVRAWDWARGRDGPWRPVAPVGLLVLEGAGAGALRCTPYLAGLVWVEAAAPVRRARALARDGAAYAPHWRRWARQEAAYLAADRPRARADVLVRTDRAQAPTSAPVPRG